MLTSINMLIGVATQGHSQTFIWVGSFRRKVDLFISHISAYIMMCIPGMWSMLKLEGSGGMPPPPGKVFKIGTKRLNLVAFQSIKITNI